MSPELIRCHSSVYCRWPLIWFVCCRYNIVGQHQALWRLLPLHPLRRQGLLLERSSLTMSALPRNHATLLEATPKHTAPLLPAGWRHCRRRYKVMLLPSFRDYTEYLNVINTSNVICMRRSNYKYTVDVVYDRMCVCSYFLKLRMKYFLWVAYCCIYCCSPTNHLP